MRQKDRETEDKIKEGKQREMGSDRYGENRRPEGEGIKTGREEGRERSKIVVG